MIYVAPSQCRSTYIVRISYCNVVLTLFDLSTCADAAVFLQDAELDALEGTNVSVCVVIELAGQLLTDINIEFGAIGGGPGAGKCSRQLESIKYVPTGIDTDKIPCLIFFNIQIRLAQKIMSRHLASLCSVETYM